MKMQSFPAIPRTYNNQRGRSPLTLFMVQTLCKYQGLQKTEFADSPDHVPSEDEDSIFYLSCRDERRASLNKGLRPI
jgi:hypothetical protein